LPRACRYQYRIGLSKRLQAGRKLDRFAEQPMLSHAVADEVAADDRSAGDADAQLQRRGAARVKPADSLDQGETSVDGFFGIEFVCLGISETDQHFVRREPIHYAAIPRDDLAAVAMVLADQRARLLWVERRCADQAADEDGKLSAFERARQIWLSRSVAGW
jgi:hypothetical protein